MYKILIRLAISAILTTATLTITAGYSLAADPTLSELLTGKTIPNTIKLRDLTPEWRGLSTSGQFEIGNTFQTIFASFLGGALGSSYYTKGQTIAMAGETYMVAYSLQEQPEKITTETNLSLSLLNLKTIGSLTNIRSFNLPTETALLEKQLQGMRTMLAPPRSPEVKPVAPTTLPATKPTRRRK